MGIGLRRIARGIAVGAVPIIVLGAGLAGAADWTLKSVPRQDAPGTRCILESPRESLSDGYQTTTAYLTVDRRSVVVITASDLDGSAGDIGLAVDDGEFVPMDRLAGAKAAAFDTKHARIVELFKAGRRVRVQLRFWPEWPATGAHSVTFSLIGFTKAYGELTGCP